MQACLALNSMMAILSGPAISGGFANLPAVVRVDRYRYCRRITIPARPGCGETAPTADLRAWSEF